MNKKILALLMSTIFVMSSCGKEVSTESEQLEVSNPVPYETVLANIENPRELPDLKEPISKTDIMLLYTTSTITVYDKGDEQLLDECYAISRHYEDILSKNELKKESSFVYKLNTSKGEVIEFPDDALECLNTGYAYSEKYSDVFDITIGALTSLWNINEATVAPIEADIQKAVSTINYKNLVIEGNKVHLTNPDTNVDLGAIAKGFIADKIADYLKSQGVKSAIIDLGGNVYVLGNKDADTGEKFRIGIREPKVDSMDPIGYIEASDISIVSSGAYEQSFVDVNTGITYSHILDKNTGYPVETDIKQISIFTKKSVDGDGLSTSLYALGSEKALEIVNSLDDTECIIITNDDKMIYSNNLGETSDKKIKFVKLK